MKKLQILLGCIVLGVVSYAAAGPLIGEAPTGTTRGLGGAIGVPISWSNPNTVLYTCTNPNGFVLLHVIPRNPTGTQPLSYTVSVVPGGGTSSAVSTGLSLVNGIFNNIFSQVVTGNMGQSVVITPLNMTSGSMLVDVLGYDGL